MATTMTLTSTEWERIEAYLAAGPSHVYADTDENGTCIIIDGFGVMHPKAYLEIMDEEHLGIKIESIDILKGQK
jgi:hypothetical protein